MNIQLCSGIFAIGRFLLRDDRATVAATSDRPTAQRDQVIAQIC